MGCLVFFLPPSPQPFSLLSLRAVIIRVSMGRYPLQTSMPVRLKPLLFGSVKALLLPATANPNPQKGERTHHMHCRGRKTRT